LRIAGALRVIPVSETSGRLRMKGATSDGLELGGAQELLAGSVEILNLAPDPLPFPGLIFHWTQCM
jgi:hypothetical protein